MLLLTKVFINGTFLLVIAKIRRCNWSKGLFLEFAYLYIEFVISAFYYHFLTKRIECEYKKIRYLYLVKKRFLEILESIDFAKQALKSNLTRTLLSLLGVTVGIFCIISALALVDSIEQSLKDSFSVITNDMIFVQKMPMGPDEDGEFKWWDYIKRRNLTYKESKKLKERLTSADAVAFQASSIKSVKYKNSSFDQAVLTGITSDYSKAIDVNIAFGRYPTSPEINSGKGVVVIGNEIAENLFIEAKNAIGKKIVIGGYKLEVLGVFEKEGNSILPGGFDVSIVIPVLFAMRLFDFEKAETSIIIKAKEGVSTEELINEAIQVLRPIRRLNPLKKDDFSVVEASMIADMMDSIFATLKIVGIGIGVCALFVGGIGIMNIMFVSVKERTKQIGIQKALGAKKRFILQQFLFESIFLCIIGAILGLVLVLLIIVVVNSFSEFKFILSFGNVAIGIVTATVLGILAGLIPSYQASTMKPVDAIRAS